MSTRPRLLVLVAAVVTVAGCAARVQPLVGADVAPAPALPPARLFDDPRRYRFAWSYRDETFEAKGDGVVRVQPPGQARLDFFLENGLAGGYAILDGDSLITPGPDFVKRLVPPPPMLWSVFGALRVPPTADTLARRTGDTLSADFGRRDDGRLWRVRFVDRRLDRVERIEDGRRVEWLERHGGEARYSHEPSRRRVSITVTDSLSVAPFDPTIFRRR
ncbi:MAG: hypothetical protein MUF00_15315 [Gemmatimonadaceae bacterium]|nr:hypothetical protein [Gemmatimonadaceae bacterium]